MESIIIAIIVSLSTLAGVYLGSRRSEPKQQVIPQENPIQELFNLEDESDLKAFNDLQKALNWNGKAQDEE